MLESILACPSFSIMCLSCFVRILFCSSYSSAWHDILVFRRLRTAVLEISVAGSGGKPPRIAVQVTPLEGVMHAWCLSILKRSRLMFDVGGVENDAYCTDLVSSDTPGPKDEITCVICR